MRSSSALPRCVTATICSVDCPVYDIAGRNRFRTKLSDADLRLAFADCKARRSGAAAFVRFLRADTKSCTARVKLRCHDD